MKKISRKLLAGLATILPLVVTVYLLYWLTTSAETLLGSLIKRLLPEGWYLPGMGIAAGIILLFFIGLLMQAWLVRTLVSWGERIVFRIPLIKTVYGSVRDLIGFVVRGQDPAVNQVVAITFSEPPVTLIGFVTREDLTAFPAEIGRKDMIAVYLPMSYQLGGYTVVVPRSAVQPLNISLEEATRFVLTGGVAFGSSPPARISRKIKKP
jgi:uncharacterized membrane protein